MKQKLIVKSFLIFFIGIIMLGCQYDTDEYQDNNQHQEKLGYKATKITLNDVKDNPIAFSKIINPTKDKSLSKLNHRIINDSINNFSIDTEIGTFIEMENYHSYTFKVIRPNGSNYLLENLVVSKDGTNEYETYLYQYDITQQELQMIKDEVSINLSDKMTRILIENSNILVNINAKEYPCFVQVTSYVDGNSCPNGHNWGETCAYYGQTYGPTAGYYVTESVLSTCNDSPGGGGIYDPSDPNDPNNIPDPGTPTTGGGGGGGTTVTTPTVCKRDCPELYEFGEAPCDKIKDGTNSPEYKQKFKALTNNYGLSHETGFVLKSVNGVDQYVDCVPDGQNMVTTPPGSKNITHVHQNIPKTVNGVSYDGRPKILSIGDLFSLIRTLQNNNPNDAFAIMQSDEGTYAITILEPIIITPELMIAINEMNKEFIAEETKIINSLYSSIDLRKEKLQKKFLKALKGLGLENKIGFFEANTENANATDINDFKINWSRIKLKNVFLGVKPEATPCN